MEKSMNEAAERLDAIRDEVVRRADELRDQVGAYVDEHPLTAIGLAFGVGYLLSGALFSRTTARVAGVGARLVLGGLWRSLVLGVGPGLILAALGDHEANGAERSDAH